MTPDQVRHAVEVVAWELLRVALVAWCVWFVFAAVERAGLLDWRLRPAGALMAALLLMWAYRRARRARRETTSP